VCGDGAPRRRPAVKRSLLRGFVRRQPDDVECPDGVDGEWFSVENDIVLAPA
jgi:hypothetical protein